MRTSTLARKRAEYASLVDVTFAKGRDGLDQQIWHQIEIDVPRTRPGVKLWMYGATQKVTHYIPSGRGYQLLIVIVSEYRTDSLRLGDTASC